MSIRAGSIVTVAGRNVVDRLQSAGLGDARIPIETVREIGNDLVVDKVPGEADFTFSMESWDVSTDLMAFLHGKIGNQVANQPPGAPTRPARSTAGRTASSSTSRRRGSATWARRAATSPPVCSSRATTRRACATASA
jgi:hypothetical protein